MRIKRNLALYAVLSATALGAVQAENLPLANFAGTWAGILYEQLDDIHGVYAVQLEIYETDTKGSEVGVLRFLDTGRDNPLALLNQGELDLSLGRIDLPEIIYSVTITDTEMMHANSDGDLYNPGRTLTFRWPGYALHGVLYEQDRVTDIAGIDRLGVREHDRRRALENTTADHVLIGGFEERVAAGTWFSDSNTDCKVLLSDAIVAGFSVFHLSGELSAITWSGECTDGFATGPGTLEWLDNRGLRIWSEEYSGHNGMAMVRGIPIANVDAARLQIRRTTCSEFAFASKVTVEYRVSFYGRLDLTYPRVITRMAEYTHDVMSGATAECLRRFPRARSYTVMIRFAAKNHPSPLEADGWLPGHISLSGRAANGKAETLELRNPLAPAYQAYGWPSELFENRVAAANEHYQGLLADHAAQLRDEEAHALTSSRTGAVIRAREGLDQDYYNLAINLAYRQFADPPELLLDFAATVPAQFPHPEFDTRGRLNCLTGEWYDGDTFDLFLALTDAERSDRSFRLKDIEISCSQTGPVEVQSADFNRTVALLDYTRQVVPMGFPSDNRSSHFISFSMDYERLRLNNPAMAAEREGSCCVSGIRLWQDNTVSAFGRIQVVGVDSGDGLQPVLFEGQQSQQYFNPASANHVYVNADGGATWNHLMFDMANGLLSWQLTRNAPQ